MNNQLTILIPTSPIPNHPSTVIIDETISNTRKYTDAEIVIMFDGVHDSLTPREKDYTEYLIRLDEKINSNAYGNCRIVFFEKHTHQSEMTKIVLRNIKTPLVLFCEHDTSMIGDIPFDNLCKLVETSQVVNYLRFNIFHKILDEHKYLMLYDEPKTNDEIPEIPYVRTIQWSQRPHIAKTGWYRDLLYTYFPVGEKMMIEDRMHSIVFEKHKALGFDTFGLAIYTPEGNQLRSYHSDGRGEDIKIIRG